MKRYIIHKGTVAILPDYDKFGNENSVVIEKDRFLHLEKRPRQIIKESFQEMGQDYRGSINGARFVLKRRNKIPFAFFAQDDIVLIPVQTIDNKGTIYLVSSHIQEVDEIPKGAKVVFKNGVAIHVGMKKRKLNDKRYQASHLKDEMTGKYKLWKKDALAYDPEPNEVLMISDNMGPYIVDCGKQMKDQ